jgi:hypothetical protein
MTTFYQGLEVSYNEHIGFVDFVSNQYITVCIQQSEERSRAVCILVYPHQWKDVRLLKESEK